jgi:hypothetical protein
MVLYMVITVVVIAVVAIAIVASLKLCASSS